MNEDRTGFPVLLKRAWQAAADRSREALDAEISFDDFMKSLTLRVGRSPVPNPFPEAPQARVKSGSISAPRSESANSAQITVHLHPAAFDRYGR